MASIFEGLQYKDALWSIYYWLMPTDQIALGRVNKACHSAFLNYMRSTPRKHGVIEGVTWVDGVRHGPATITTDVTTTKCTYVDGVMEGVSICYIAGRGRSISQIKGGKRNGVMLIVREMTITAAYTMLDDHPLGPCYSSFYSEEYGYVRRTGDKRIITDEEYAPFASQVKKLIEEVNLPLAIPRKVPLVEKVFTSFIYYHLLCEIYDRLPKADKRNLRLVNKNCSSLGSS